MRVSYNNCLTNFTLALLLISKYGHIDATCFVRQSDFGEQFKGAIIQNLTIQNFNFDHLRDKSYSWGRLNFFDFYVIGLCFMVYRDLVLAFRLSESIELCGRILLEYLMILYNVGTEKFNNSSSKKCRFGNQILMLTRNYNQTLILQN